MMRLLPIALLAGMMMSGCANDEGGSVPAFVQKMMNADFPADGEIHVQKAGKFEIGPETLFCFVDADIDPKISDLGVTGIGVVGIEKALKAIGQSDYLDGSGRTRRASERYCPINAGNVMIKGFVRPNSDGTPYRLTISVWQGDAAWVGVVERGPANFHPDVFVPDDDIYEGPVDPAKETKRYNRVGTRESVYLDVSDTSKKFISNLIESK